MALASILVDSQSSKNGGLNDDLVELGGNSSLLAEFE
jgi:hypothetical protein